jgi:hypothetical protein
MLALKRRATSLDGFALTKIEAVADPLDGLFYLPTWQAFVFSKTTPRYPNVHVFQSPPLRLNWRKIQSWICAYDFKLCSPDA